MVDEKFEFTGGTKRNLLIFIAVGVLFTIIGIFSVSSGGHHDDHGSHEAEMHQHDGGELHSHAKGASEAHGDHETGEEEHHGSATWLKRVFANLWINNVFFAGLALIGVFFFALQYAAQAGWSAGLKRIPLAFGAWLPYAGILMIIVFAFGGHDLFHWTHASLYLPLDQGGDEIIQGKSAFFFWPLDGGSTPIFFIARMIIFFAVWYVLFLKLKAVALSEDVDGGTDKWYKMRKLSAIFILFFAVSSSISAWDWVMSIDAHWFSTMFGWYMFASWWVSGLALIAFIVVLLKDKGYLSVVNSNHLHDIGKFMFAFSIFWTYVWFSQFLLIYYAHIPEETIYFVERWKSDQYSPLFFLNLIVNFFLPFLILMPRDSKRHSRILKVAAPIIIIGHWLDFYLMITPGTMKENGGFGFLELGLMFVYAGAFIFVVLNQLSKVPLFAKNHPMLKESLHHHI
ncbi:MAG: quinol:cytochrome C oxidoreductase [Cyclobacteriaceae bacterium]